MTVSLKYVERILNQNHYHKYYIQYRNYPEVKFEKLTLDEDTGKRPGFKNRNIKQDRQDDDEVIESKEKPPLT